MQDRDIPQVEGEIGGDVDVVRPIAVEQVAQQQAVIGNKTASIQPLWTTVIGRP